MARALWRFVEIAIPCLLVVLSTILMAAAVGAMLLGAPAGDQWELFLAALLCWGAGIGWGLVANERGSWLRRPW